MALNYSLEFLWVNFLAYSVFSSIHGFSFVSTEYNSLNSLVSEAFIRFFLETIGHYSLFITQNDRGERVFQRETFRKSVASKSIRRFLGVFMESQMFAGFIQDRELRKTRAKGRLSPSPWVSILWWISPSFLKALLRMFFLVLTNIAVTLVSSGWNLVWACFVTTSVSYLGEKCNCSHPHFIFLFHRLCCCADRFVWAEGGSLSGGAARHGTEWSQQVSERPWWVLQQI